MIPHNITKIAKVLLEEIEKYYPDVMKKTYDDNGYYKKDGSSAQTRAEICIYIELMKAGAFNKEL